VQPLLFETGQTPREYEITETIKKIDGVFYTENFLSPAEERLLLSLIDQEKWESTLKRRVQHFGYRYNYDPDLPLTKTTPMPVWANRLARKTETAFHTPILPLKNGPGQNSPAAPVFNQLIVNEYLPGQGIGLHVDRTEHFKDPLAIISLGSDTGYQFILPDYGELKIDNLLQNSFSSVISNEGNAHPAFFPDPKINYSDLARETFRKNKVTKTFNFMLPSRSLLLLSGAARYLWMHGVPARKTDLIDGVRVARSRRISVTYRVTR